MFARRLLDRVNTLLVDNKSYNKLLHQAKRKTYIFSVHRSPFVFECLEVLGHFPQASRPNSTLSESALSLGRNSSQRQKQLHLRSRRRYKHFSNTVSCNCIWERKNVRESQKKQERATSGGGNVL